LSVRAAIAVAALLVAVAAACDPQLNLASPRPEQKTIEGCEQAVAHLKECCPQYESYVSCAVYDNGSPDLSARQSRCLRARDCGAIEKAVSAGADVCGVTFAGRRCR
jgi:hypothetical protein